MESVSKAMEVMLKALDRSLAGIRLGTSAWLVGQFTDVQTSAQICIWEPSTEISRPSHK